MTHPHLPRVIVAEALGTAGLLCAVVGSGVMAERLAGGNVAIALLANTLATGAALIALLLTFGPVSGAQLNPVVTIAAALLGELRWPQALAMVAAQVAGAVGGVVVAHAMFEQTLLQASTKERSGPGQWLAEVVATAGLLLVIAGVGRTRASAVPFAVAAWVIGAYWFTSSTSFANPAVTLARGLTDTFAGIRPGDVPAFVAAQLVGGVAGALLGRWLFSRPVESP